MKSKVLISKTPIDKYQKVLIEKELEMKNKHNINEDKTEIIYVAKEDGAFIGGIKMEAYNDHIYTHLLAVKKAYRGKQVGYHLMQYAEKEAMSRNIRLLEVGTASFQARGFYEKLGYHVIHTRKNNPKGYETYTLVKHIKQV